MNCKYCPHPKHVGVCNVPVTTMIGVTGCQCRVVPQILGWQSHTVLPLAEDKDIYYSYTVELADGSTRDVDITRDEWTAAIRNLLQQKLEHI